MILRVTIRNFKRFQEQAFELADSVLLAGPNNAGKSTLLQAVAFWKFALDRWLAHREGGRAVERSGVAIPRADITAVPLREMNLLWEDRKVTGPRGMSGARRMIEILVEGQDDGETWICGIELQYHTPELAYARPLDAKSLDRKSLQMFPPHAARQLSIVHVPPLSGIERDEPRRDRGMQDLLVGQGRPGEILRNLLLEIAEGEDGKLWLELQRHIRDLFGIELIKPSYSPAQPYIVCEYREPDHSRPFDLSNAGSGTLQVLLLLGFLYARPATVILLDEPDAHQHVILQKQVYDLVRRIARERGGQVIAATHSEVVLDATEPSRVIGLFREAPRALDSETERDQLREALKRVTTTDLLLAQEAGAVLYVESETDERMLAEWTRILDHPARLFFERPFVHWLGGRSLREAKAHFFAMRSAYPTLRGLCLLDGDNRDEPDAETTRAGLDVLRWRRYEIENYLLQPEAIKRFVDFPLRDSQIDDVFWSQVPRGTDLFGEHVSLERVKASTEFLVPLLEDLERSTPKKDLYLLASRMKAEEIHPEIREKLDRIGESLNPR
ncbi:MAG: AAA family ATPase [Gemmatimonadaceae bacterium]|nr:AAA family ATPase [Gemmatimonadaceae bacterium]